MTQDSGRNDDRITIAAIGILSYIVCDLAHEVAGHGMGLLMAGGRSGVLTTTRLIYSHQLPDPQWRLFDLGGPAGNLLWAGACFLAQRAVSAVAPRLRLFLWASVCFSLLWEAGYVIKCGVTGQGDWMALIEGLRPIGFWRAAMLVMGIAFYRGALSVISSELRFVVNPRGSEIHSRVSRLLFALCAAGGLVACFGAIFDPRGRTEMLNSGALSSFGCWVGLLFVPQMYAQRAQQKRGATGPVERSLSVIVLAVIGAVLFIGLLGAGIRISL